MTFMRKSKWEEITPPSARRATVWEKILCWYWGHQEGLPRGEDFQWCYRCNRRWSKVK